MNFVHLCSVFRNKDVTLQIRLKLYEREVQAGTRQAGGGPTSRIYIVPKKSNLNFLSTVFSCGGVIKSVLCLYRTGTVFY